MYNKHLILLLIVSLHKAFGDVSPTESELQLYTGTNTDIIFTALENLDKLITNLRKSAHDQFEKHLTALELQCQSYINETLTNMDIAIEPALSQIDNIEDGTIIKDCAKIQETKLKATYLQLSNGMVQCYTNKVREANDIVHGAIIILQEYPKILLKLREDFKKCASAWCNSKVLLSATYNSADISLEIPKLIVHTVELIETASVSIQMCNAHKVALMTAETANALLEIGVCTSTPQEA